MEQPGLSIEQVRLYALKQARTSTVHGISHWERVAENGRRLYAEGVNARVVELFAYLHDICRQDDGHDPEHGPRAAEKIIEIRHTLLADLTDDEFALLQQAVRCHTSHHQTGDITVDTCFDSDRLDLGRVGIEPDPARMATEKGRQLAADLARNPFPK